MSRIDKKYIIEEEEEDEDSYKDLSSEEEEEHAPEDLFASVTTVVKVDTISKSPAKGGGSYAQMYKNSKKSSDNLQQQPKNTSSSKGQSANPRICLVNDSLVSLSAIKKANMNSFPQRYQADLTCSYSISESSIPENQTQKEEEEEENDGEDEYENEEQDEKEEEEGEDEDEEAHQEYNEDNHEENYETEEYENQEEEPEEQEDNEEEDQEEEDFQVREIPRSTNNLKALNSSRSSMAMSSIRTSIAEEMRYSTQHQNSAYGSDNEDETDELDEEEKEQIDEEIDEAVLPPSSSMTKSMLKHSFSEKIVSEESSLANTIKTEIEEMEEEEGDDYKDLEELENEVEENFEIPNNHVHRSVEKQNEDFPIIVTHEETKQEQSGAVMKENILQSISLFKQYKATQVSQSVVGLDHSSKKLKAPTDQPLRVSKVLEIPKPNINLNESISENDMDKIKKQNHLLRMQLLEQQRMIEEGKVVLQERIEQEIEKAKSQALKEFISSKKQQQTPSPSVEQKPEKKTLRDIKKSESPEKKVETIRVKESSKPNKKEVIEILPDEFENTTDMKKQMEVRNKKFLELRKQKIEKIEENKKKEKPQPAATSEAKTAENGMILKNMKQQNKTNKLLIKNALIHLTLAGEVNKKEREDVFETMKEYEDTNQMILLVREVNVPAFRALYVVVTDGLNANVGSSTSTTDSNRTDNSSRSESPGGSDKRPDQILVKKIIGKGPKFLTEDIVDVFCRYDSGGKKLSKLSSRTFGVTTDVVVLKSAAIKKIKR